MLYIPRYVYESELELGFELLVIFTALVLASSFILFSLGNRVQYIKEFGGKRVEYKRNHSNVICLGIILTPLGYVISDSCFRINRMALKKVTIANTVLSTYPTIKNSYVYGRKFRSSNANEFSITFYDSQITRYDVDVLHTCPLEFDFHVVPHKGKGKTTYKFTKK